MNQILTGTGYAAARAAAAWARLAGWGRLRLAGRDRLAFPQRLSTNDFRSLAPGQGRATVFTTATGRVLAPVSAWVAPGEVWLRTEPGQSAALANYLNRMIFFNDEITVSDLSDETAGLALYGPKAGSLLAQLGAGDLPEQDDTWCEAVVAGEPVQIQRNGAWCAFPWSLMCAAQAVEPVAAALAQLAPEVTPAEVEVLRVEDGVPAWGRELSDAVTPLEAGLAGSISFNKGCYTGQEVIARQANYDKVPRRLMGLLLPEDRPAEEARRWIGATVRAGGGKPGFVGSVVASPALGRLIALAIVPRPDAEPGQQVVIEHDGAELAATVSALPFVARPDAG